MTKSEFLNTLRMQLQGELSPSQIEGHLHYYNEYISEAVASGRSESDVLEELGSPVFIAKTLLETANPAEPGGEDPQEGYGYYGTDDYAQGEDDGYFRRKVKTWHVHPLVLRWVLPVVIFFVLFLLLSLVGSVMVLVARFFVPILLIVLVIHIFNNHER